MPQYHLRGTDCKTPKYIDHVLQRAVTVSYESSNRKKEYVKFVSFIIPRLSEWGGNIYRSSCTYKLCLLIQYDSRSSLSFNGADNK